jgi:hypothetical protein
MSSLLFEDQKKIWREEQEKIATQVIVLEDKQDELNDPSSSYSSEFYEFARIEVSSPSYDSDKSNQVYFGGVDVSISTSDNQMLDDNLELAVAVYCILNASCEVVYMVRWKRMFLLWVCIHIYPLTVCPFLVLSWKWS